MRTSISIYHDIYLDDIMSELSTKQTQQLVDELFEDGFKAKKDNRTDLDNDFDIQISKLFGNKHKLTSEDEATVLLIANKIIL